MQIKVSHLGELPVLANKILSSAGEERIFVFYGEMGAGKTTLINQLCKQLGVTEHTSSPTFSIVNEYEGKENKIFHFDFYRIKNESEAFDFGYEDYFYSGEYCMIEWPEKIPNLLPDKYIRVKITSLSETERLVDIRSVSEHKSLQQ